MAGQSAADQTGGVEGTVVIVGAGEAGMAAAAALRASNFAGRVVLVTNEPGLPYERPPLSKQRLLSLDEPDCLIRPGDWFEAQGIELRAESHVTSIDPKRQLAFLDGGDVIEYGALLLATGARPRRLSGDPACVHYLRTSGDADDLCRALGAARSVVVIGGGVIGLEVASTAVSLGLSVTVLDPAPRLMERALVPEISTLLADLHRAAGVSLVLNSGPIDVVPNGAGGVRVTARGVTHEADVCVAGIGVIPNDELARSAGCRVENGLVVDGCGRTSVEHIYAAGDVAAFNHPIYDRVVRIESWQHAGRHGAHVARAMLGVDDGYAEVPWFWTDQLGTNLQVAGLVADCERTEWRGTTTAGTAFHFKEGALRAVSTLNNGRDMRPAINLLAAGWIGDPAVLTDMSQPFRKIATDALSARHEAVV